MTATAAPTGTPAGPRGSRLLGLTREMNRDPLGTYEQVMRANPTDLGRVDLGLPGMRLTMHLASHPDGVRDVLVNSEREHTKDQVFYREIAESIGDGLLTSEGPVWRRQRRTLAPLFTPRRIATYAAGMTAESETVAARWRAAARAGRPVELHGDMTEYTLHVVARLLFGTSVDTAVPVVREMFPVLSGYVRSRGLSPIRLPRSWPTPGQRRATRARRALYEVVDGIIEQRRSATDDRADDRADDTASDDLVTRLLAARDPETGDPLSPTEVRDQILIFLLAGHETTSTALTFALHLLGHHAAVQDKVRAEIAEAIGDRAPTSDDVARLPYTDMVLREAMRLYPPAYAFGRVTPTGATVAGHPLPPGSIVVVSPWATHRHPHFWPEPDRFDPDRFTAERVAARHKYAYLPFSGGPRNCIGNHFAMMEAVIAVACLLRTVRLRTDPGPVPLETGITLRPGRAMRAEVEEIT